MRGVGPIGRAQRVFLPALASFPLSSWPLVGLLPVLDVNGALVQALGALAPFRAAPPIAGVFACDPFLRLADLAVALRRAGIREVLNFPTVQHYGGDTAAALASVGYRAEAEYRVLLRLGALGFTPITCAASRAAADAALALGLRRVLLHPGPTLRPATADWWPDLAAHIAVEGGEALAWAAPDQSVRPRRRMRL